MTPVKDQGHCGSCWAFGSNGVVEAKYNIETGTQQNLNLSEEYFVSNCIDRNYRNWSLQRGDCAGGPVVLDVIQNYGVIDTGCLAYSSGPCWAYFNEDGSKTGNKTCTRDYPYPNGTLIFHTISSPDALDLRPLVSRRDLDVSGGTAASLPDEPKPPDFPCKVCNDWQSRLWKIMDWGTVPGKIADVKQRLLCSGPLTVISPCDREHIHWCHAVVLMGWDDDKQVWLIKNSWGENYEDHGYGAIPYDKPIGQDFLKYPFYVSNVYHEGG
jgi:hypothetical protein